MRLTSFLITLLTLYSVFADNCSVIITERKGTLQSISNDCPTITYSFQNPSETSFWILHFTNFTVGSDQFVVYDGPDYHSRPIIETQAKYMGNRDLRSTQSYMTMLVTRPINIGPWSSWELQFTNYEQNSSVVSENGYDTVGEDNVDFVFQQEINGLGEDYIGSSWIIRPNIRSDYYDDGIELKLILDSFQDSTGTLQVIIEYAGFTTTLSAMDVGRTDQNYYYPLDTYDAEIIIHSAVRTEEGSYSSFQVRVMEAEWWSSSTSSGTPHHHYAGRIILFGVLIGIGFMIGVSVVIYRCYKGKNGSTVKYSKQVDMTPAMPLNHSQPMYVMVPPPYQQQCAVPVPYGMQASAQV